jgi:UDP-2,3-diacylglucosamine hydrolase
VQRAFRALPFAARQAIGRGLRKQSARRPPRAHGDFVDVDADAALAWLRDSCATTLVHGHTHRPASHQLAPHAMRHVLSDWELDGSSAPRAEILRWDASGFARVAPATAARPAP